MRRFARVALAAALLVPAGIAVSGPAQAADAPAAFCHRSVPNGNMTATPGLKYLVKRAAGVRAHDGRPRLQRRVRSRRQHQPAHAAAGRRSAAPPWSAPCANSGSSSGLFTWTKPANSGKSKFHGNITITASSGHTMTAKLKGVDQHVAREHAARRPQGHGHDPLRQGPGPHDERRRLPAERRR